MIFLIQQVASGTYVDNPMVKPDHVCSPGLSTQLLFYFPGIQKIEVKISFCLIQMIVAVSLGKPKNCRKLMQRSRM